MINLHIMCISVFFNGLIILSFTYIHIVNLIQIYSNGIEGKNPNTCNICYEILDESLLLKIPYLHKSFIF